MSLALDLRCLTVLLAMPTTFALSVWIGVGGWGWPISPNVVHNVVASLALLYNAPSSASVADDITFFRILLVVCIAPLLGGSVTGGLALFTLFCVRIKWPPTRLLARGSELYEASL